MEEQDGTHRKLIPSERGGTQKKRTEVSGEVWKKTNNNKAGRDPKKRTEANSDQTVSRGLLY